MANTNNTWIERLLAMPWWKTVLLAAASLLLPYLIALIYPAGATQSGIAFKQNMVSGAQLLSYVAAASLLLITLYNLIKLPPHPAKAEEKANSSSATPERVADEKPEATPEPQQAWSLALLQSLSRAHFKALNQALFEELGLIARPSDCGADFDLYARNSADAPVALAKCKPGKEFVNAHDILEFCGIVDQTGMGKSYYTSASSFTDDARNFSETCEVTLVTGKQLLKLIQSRSAEKSAELLKIATAEA